MIPFLALHEGRCRNARSRGTTILLIFQREHYFSVGNLHSMISSVNGREKGSELQLLFGRQRYSFSSDSFATTIGGSSDSLSYRFDIPEI